VLTPTKATPAVPAVCLDRFLSDAAIAFSYNPNPTVSTPCPRSVDQTWPYSGLSNEILSSAPLLLQCVLQKKKINILLGSKAAADSRR